MTDSQPAPSMQPLPSSPSPQGPTGPRRGNPAGIAALLIAVIALLFGIGALAGTFLGLPGWLVAGLEGIAFFLGFVALVVAIIALVLKNRRKAGAAIGLVVAIIAGLTAIVTFAIGAIGAFNSSKDAYDSLASAFPSGIGGLATDLPSDFPSDLPSDLPSDFASLLPSSQPALAAGSHTVTYSVTGTGDATVAYGSSLDASAAPAGQQTLPFQQSSTVTSTGTDLTTFNLEVASTSGSGSVECKITVDGTVVADKTSSGSLRVALCLATFGQ